MGNGLLIARDAAAHSRGERLTDAQRVLLEDVLVHPGEWMVDAKPNVIAACVRKGWLEPVRQDQKRPWTEMALWITRAGEAALARDKA